MAVFEGDVPVTEVRIFRDNDGKATAQFITAHATPAPADEQVQEPDFTGESYLNLELHLDHEREVEHIKPGTVLHITIDVPTEETT